MSFFGKALRNGFAIGLRSLIGIAPKKVYSPVVPPLTGFSSGFSRGFGA